MWTSLFSYFERTVDFSDDWEDDDVVKSKILKLFGGSSSQYHLKKKLLPFMRYW